MLRKKYFKCPKIVGNNIDLLKHKIYVVYQKANENITTLMGEVGKYWCEDAKVDETGDYIEFSWLLSGNVLGEQGFIAFKVVAVYTDTETGELKTRWNTVPSIGLVRFTLSDGEEITEQYADVISQLLQRMDAVEDIATPEAMQRYVEQYLQLHPTELDETLTDSKKAAPANLVGQLKEDLVTTQKAYLINPRITNNLYVNAEGAIIGYDGWDLADIPVLGGDKIIIYSPTDSKYNAMYFANYANFKNVELKNGLNYIDIPDGYRSLVVSNEREIMKKVRFLVFPMQVINSNNEKLKKADKGKVLFNKVPYTYINNVDGNEINSDTYSSSDFIELTDCKNFVIECQEDSDSNALYDENKNFIQSIEYNAGITEFEKITNAKYLRISCHTDFLETASVIFDSSISYRDFIHESPVLPRKKDGKAIEKQSLMKRIKSC